MSPQFLYRIEAVPATVPASGNYRISQLELASRLSFFLWSSIPDDQLLNLATAGRLREPLVLEQQVKRMLADSRANSLTQNFADQWLQLRDNRKRQSRSDHVSGSGQNVTAVAA